VVWEDGGSNPASYPMGLRSPSGPEKTFLSLAYLLPLPPSPAPECPSRYHLSPEMTSAPRRHLQRVEHLSTLLLRSLRSFSGAWLPGFRRNHLKPLPHHPWGHEGGDSIHCNTATCLAAQHPPRNNADRTLSYVSLALPLLQLIPSKGTPVPRRAWHGGSGR